MSHVDVHERYWWHQMKDAFDELLYALAEAEDEEEVGFYLLSLHRENRDDYQYFLKEEEEKIKKHLSYLMKETKNHREILAEVVREVENLRGAHERKGELDGQRTV